MMMVKWYLLLSGALVVVSPMAAAAQEASNRTVDQYVCKDIMKEGGSTRDTAVAFLHGYLLGKAGGTKFDLEVLAKQTDAFVDRCLENPNEKAIDAMAKVKQ